VLAGTWTATGWPATLEGAVLSGHAAADTVLRGLGVETARGVAHAGAAADGALEVAR
jgi:Flavin containing amine oxidoreductase